MKSALTVRKGTTPFGQKWYINEDENGTGHYLLYIEKMHPIKHTVSEDEYVWIQNGTVRQCVIAINREIKSQQEDLANM